MVFGAVGRAADMIVRSYIYIYRCVWDELTVLTEEHCFRERGEKTFRKVSVMFFPHFQCESQRKQWPPI